MNDLLLADIRWYSFLVRAKRQNFINKITGKGMILPLLEPEEEYEVFSEKWGEDNWIRGLKKHGVIDENGKDIVE